MYTELGPRGMHHSQPTCRKATVWLSSSTSTILPGKRMASCVMECMSVVADAVCGAVDWVGLRTSLRTTQRVP